MNRYVITLIINPKARTLSDEDVQVITAGLNITQTDWLSEGEACDVFVEADAALKLRADNLDIIIQASDTRKKKLLICDMDSTIIEQECIDELADKVGLKAQVEKITERAMNGELDFAEALRSRVALLRGLPVSALQDVYDNQITFTPGAKELVATMREAGAHCMLVSGGFTFFTSRVAQELGFHENKANILNTGQDVLTGHVAEPILGSQAKLEALNAACLEKATAAQDVIAIGDGANDLPMLKAAGLGVAYHAKPIVREATNASLNHTNLRGALFAQGYKVEEFKS